MPRHHRAAIEDWEGCVSFWMIDDQFLVLEGKSYFYVIRNWEQRSDPMSHSST